MALSTLIFAILAALGGLLSGITAHESQLEKIEQVRNFTILEGDRDSGMSVVIEQKWIWSVGMVFGAVGSIGVILGIIYRQPFISINMSIITA